MAASRPVVAANAGGPKEIVVNAVTGRLVDGGEVDGYMQAVTALAADAHLRERMGLAARRRYDECFRVDRMVDALEIQFERLREAG
jgi:glycosyltransferase involved in cell wall biosynthesis